MIKIVLANICLAGFIFAFQGSAKADPQKNCMLTYFKTKDPTCVDEVVTLAGQLPANAKGPSNTIVGFLSELFRTSPQEKDRILAGQADRATKTVEMIALFRTGSVEEAGQFAVANGLSAPFEQLRASRIPSIAEAKPLRSPGENDALIGAYSVSGNRDHLLKILDNFTGVEDSMAADAIRLSLLLGKFGATFVPKGRESVVTRSACEKYSCKADPSNFMRVLTLATGLWALQALARDDEGARTTVNTFVSRRKALKTLLQIEQNAFGNYLTLVVALSALKGDEARGQNPEALDAMSRSVGAYERLDAAAEAFQPMSALKKPH